MFIQSCLLVDDKMLALVVYVPVCKEWHQLKPMDIADNTYLEDRRKQRSVQQYTVTQLQHSSVSHLLAIITTALQHPSS